MATSRNPKRARKKEAAAARRAALLEEMQRQRRRRRALLAGSLVVLAGGIAAATLGVNMLRGPGGPTPGPTPAGPATVACGADKPDKAGEDKPTFGAPEDQKLDAKEKRYIWRLETSCGRVDVELDAGSSPKTANSIVFLTRKGFYDGLTFHRVVRDFVIQGGDPEGTGSGGPGYSVEEKPADDLKYTRGVVAMAKAGPEPDGTSGSQFFIVVGDSGLPPQYAFVGTVQSGMDAVDDVIGVAGPGDGPPTELVYIEKATIVEETK